MTTPSVSSKICPECGEVFHRTLENNRNFSRQRFCSNPCADGTRPAALAAIGAEVFVHVQDRESIASSSAGLLTALLRYGLRHDGLPGLAAERLLALAGEMGVVA